MKAVFFKYSLLSIILLSGLCLWGNAATASEPQRVMIMPVTAKNADLERYLAAFTAHIKTHFGNDSRMLMLGEDQLQSLLGASTGNNQQLLQVAGEKLGCQAALSVTLERYRERLGDEYSATDPASLAFSFRLTNLADGKVTCFGQFDETQLPVSENVLTIGQAFKRGFKWITIADLTGEALKRKFSACPELTAPVP